MSQTETTAHPLAVFRHELNAMERQFLAALPPQIPAARFGRVVQTAVQTNPALLRVERRSLWNAVMKAAHDGLLPDGREAALVVYKDKRRGEIAQYLPMIAGLRKKVRNSGEIATWEAHVVHENDAFDYEEGDQPFIRHRPNLHNPGRVIGAYSVAKLKTGETTREVMSIDQILAVRERSRAKDSGPWVTDFEEMCRKTVAKRHSKVLPMSTDLDDLMRRDDDVFEPDADAGGSGGAQVAAADRRPVTIAGRLDALVQARQAPQTAIDSEDPSAGLDDAGGETIDGATGEIIEHEQENGHAEPATPAAPVTAAEYFDRAAALIDGADDPEEISKWWNSAAQRKLRSQCGLSVDAANELKKRLHARVSNLLDERAEQQS